MLPAATRSTVGQTTAAARRVVADLDRAGQERRRAAARAMVDVRVYAEDDGLGVLFARLPMADAARLHAVLDARAHDQTPGHEHATGPATPLGQRRARALVDAVCGAEAGGGGDGVGVEIQVVVDLATLLGLDDRPGTLRRPPPATRRSPRRPCAS